MSLPRFFQHVLMARGPLRVLNKRGAQDDGFSILWPNMSGEPGIVVDILRGETPVYQSAFGAFGKSQFLALGLGTWQEEKPFVLITMESALDRDTGKIRCTQLEASVPWLHPDAASQIPAARFPALADELRSVQLDDPQNCVRLLDRMHVFMGLAGPTPSEAKLEDPLQPVLVVFDTDASELLRAWESVYQTDLEEPLTTPMRNLLDQSVLPYRADWSAPPLDDPAAGIGQLLASGITDVAVDAGAGCGKTTTGAGLVQDALEQGKRVLVCASSSPALEVFLERLHPSLRSWAVNLPSSRTTAADHALMVNVQQLLAALINLDMNRQTGVPDGNSDWAVPLWQAVAPNRARTSSGPQQIRWQTDSLLIAPVANLAHKVLCHLSWQGKRFLRQSLSNRLAKALPAWLNRVLTALRLRRERRQSQALESAIHVCEEYRDAGLSPRALQALGNRMNSDGRPHLIAWAKAVERVGRGTGRHAAVYREDAREHLESALPFVPLVLATPSALLENLTRFRRTFDLLIIDEATQFGTELAWLLNLADRAVIIGDQAQLAAPQIGVSRAPEQLLRRIYLPEHPFADTLTAASSFFDVAQIVAHGRWVMRTHFRCHPSIVGYSNCTSYRDSPLQPERAEQDKPLGDPLEWVHLPPKSGKFRASEADEADAVVQRVLDIIKDPRCAGRSIAVISLNGPEQVTRIETKMRKLFPPDVWHKHKLRVGLAYHFQGSECDIALLSLAVRPHGPIRAMTRADHRRRLNVAMTRARHKVIVFSTVAATDLRPNCLRRELLEFLEGSPAAGQDDPPTQALSESTVCPLPTHKAASQPVNLSRQIGVKSRPAESIPHSQPRSF